MIARLAWLDMARGLAVIAMVIFHLIWDLAHFGYIEHSIPWSTPVKAFGHVIAFSFLSIAGLSLAMAHRDHIRWPAFWRRFAVIAGAAALVSAGTYAVFPNAWVFFGILHVIAAASLAALPFLHAPWIVTLAAGALALAAPWFIASPVFDSDWLMWLGLGTREPMTQDWRPFFPWVGALLIGVAAGRKFSANLTKSVGRSEQRNVALLFLGRHSLPVYLVHQPALFALFSAIAFIYPAPDTPASFVAACETQCVAEGGIKAMCKATCACIDDNISKHRSLDGAVDDAERARRINAIARKCTSSSDAAGSH